MPRRPFVRYFPSRKAYYCQIDGDQHRLASGPDDQPSGPTFFAALEVFKQLMETGNLANAGDGNTVRAVLDEYLDRSCREKSPKTFAIRRDDFRLFSGRWGLLRCEEIRPWHAHQIITEMRTPRYKGKRILQWGDNRVRMFCAGLSAAFNWAVRQELISRNPLRALEAPSAKTKARDRVLTPEEHARVLSVLVKPRQVFLRRVVIALEASGARPGEICNARASDWDGDLRAIVYYADDKRRQDEFRHKTGGHKDRVIYLFDEALDMVKTLVSRKKPGDLIFPTKSGTKYTTERLANAFARLRQRTGLMGLVPYTYRHTFATRWLAKGESIDILATLLGNTPQTIRKHYSHLCQEHDTIRAHLERVRRGGGVPEPVVPA